MLYIIVLFVLTVLTSIGLSVIINNVCKQFLKPTNNCRCVFNVIPFSENCSDMETSVAFFSRVCEGKAINYTIILSDELNDCNLECARLLSEKYSNVFLCNGKELYSLIQSLDNATK